MKLFPAAKRLDVFMAHDVTKKAYRTAMVKLLSDGDREAVEEMQDAMRVIENAMPKRRIDQ